MTRSHALRAVIAGALTLLASAPHAWAQGSPVASSPDAARVIVITLPEALRAARERQEDWAILQAQLTQSEARQRQVLARMLPQLNLNARLTRLGREIAFQERVIRPQYDWATGAQASVVLFDGTMYPALAQAEQVVGQTRALTRWQRQLLLMQVELAYHTLGAAERDLELLEQAAALRQLQLRRAQALVQAQLATALDVERAQLALIQATLATQEAQLTVMLASDQLLVLTGQPAGQRLSVQGWEPPAAAPTPAQPLAARADLEAAALGVEAARLGERSVWWGLAPRLTLGLAGDLGPQTFANPDGFQWSITLSLAWTLYDGGALYARAQEQALQAQILALQRQQQLRQASAQLLALERESAQAQLAMESAQAQVQVAQRALDLAQRRFEQSLATQLDINDATDAWLLAQRQLNQARLRLAQVRTQLRDLGQASRPEASQGLPAAAAMD